MPCLTRDIRVAQLDTPLVLIFYIIYQGMVMKMLCVRKSDGQIISETESNDPSMFDLKLDKLTFL